VHEIPYILQCKKAGTIIILNCFNVLVGMYGKQDSTESIFTEVGRTEKTDEKFLEEL
jgi:hypothetical protein